MVKHSALSALALASLPLTVAKVIPEAAWKPRLQTLADAGVFSTPIVLTGHVYDVNIGQIENALTALEKGEREDFAKASALVLVRNTEEKAGPLATSYAPRLGVTVTNWPAEGMINGALVIVGESGSGKTTWIARRSVDLVVRVSEPLESVDSRPDTIKAADFGHAIGCVIAASAGGYHVALDSLRGMMYGLQGNTMEGGVSAGLFEVLTTLNNVVASLGSTVVFAVNPMTGDPSKLGVLLSRVEASVAGLIFMKDRDVERIAYRSVDGRRHATMKGDLLPSNGESFESDSSSVVTSHMRNMLGWGDDQGSARDISAASVLSSDGHTAEAPAATTFPRLKF